MRGSNRRKYRLLWGIASAAIFASLAYSHSQNPCGIYDDPARFDEVSGHITTIEKLLSLLEQFRVVYSGKSVAKGHEHG